MENKEWFLSGLGIFLLGGVIWFWNWILSWFIHPKQAPARVPPRTQPVFVGPPVKKERTLEEAMDQIFILFIDDDVRFKVVSILQTAGWKNTSIVKDVASLTEESIRRTAILFVDINGVGKKLGFKDEGLGLAQALKQRYPEKRVIIYSADTKAERFHPAWKLADEYLAKNADPYEFQQLVEDFAMHPDE